MARLTNKELSELTTLQQSQIESLRAQVQYHEQEMKKVRSELAHVYSEIRWHKRVIECLVSPDDNKRVF